MEKIYANDSQIGMAEASLVQNRYQLEQQLNKKKTDLDLSLSYIINGYSKSPFGGTADFGKSKLHGISATLTWKVPLGDQATIENILQKRLEQQQLNLQIGNTSILKLENLKLMKSGILIQKEMKW